MSRLHSPLATRLTLACAATAALTLVCAPAALAGTHSSDSGSTKERWSRTLSTDVAAPFNLAVAGGKVFVADGYRKSVGVIGDDGKFTELAKGIQTPTSDVAGLDVVSQKLWAYTTSDVDPETGAHSTASLIVKRDGKPDQVVDLLAYEKSANPDGKVTYGLQDYTSGSCPGGEAFLKLATQLDPTYQGIQDSHPYSVASLGRGAWAVADAGGNDILKVDATGKVSTLAVLPKQKLTFTSDMLSAVQAPAEASCLAGLTYAWEAVPTDVEVGPFGILYVTTLAGGPEDPRLGARSSVYVVSPWGDGHSWKLAGGFSGATNVAVATDGTSYVTELFGGKISQLTPWGKKSDFVSTTMPLAIEVTGQTVYAATLGSIGDDGSVLSNGSIIKYRR